MSFVYASVCERESERERETDPGTPLVRADVAMFACM